MSKILGGVHLGERVGDKPKEQEPILFGVVGGGRVFLHKWLEDKGYKVSVINPKVEYNIWNPLLEAKGHDEIHAVIRAFGVNGQLYLALAGLVRYGGFIEDQKRNLATMSDLENQPLEQLDKIFEDEHRSGNLPVFFYEHWKNFRSSLLSIEEVGD